MGGGSRERLGEKGRPASRAEPWRGDWKETLRIWSQGLPACGEQDMGGASPQTSSSGKLPRAGLVQGGTQGPERGRGGRTGRVQGDAGEGARP